MLYINNMDFELIILKLINYILWFFNFKIIQDTNMLNTQLKDKQIFFRCFTRAICIIKKYK